MAKMTRDQALDMLDKQISKVGEAGIKRVDAGLPALKAASKSVADEVKSGESADMLETLLRQLKLKVKPVAEGVALLDEAVRRLNEAEKDEEVFELAADEITKAMKLLTGPLEKARKELLAAKGQVTAGEKKLGEHGRDSASAAKEWAGFYAEFERKLGLAKKEYPAWEAYEKEALAASDARDKAKLERLRKAKPPSAMLDEILATPNGKPFAAFDKEFDFNALSKELQAEMSRDRAVGLLNFNKMRALAESKKTIEVLVAGFKIEARDGRKGLVALGLPGAALAKLQAVLDGPESARLKSLETLSKQFKLDMTPKEMLAKLQKAGVL